MNNQGKKGNRFRWPRAGAEEAARNALGLPSLEEMDFGEYLDGQGVPIKGINPKPKYFVVSKEPPKQLQPLKATVKKRKQPLKAVVKKQKPPVKVAVKKCKPTEIHKSED